MDRVIIKGAGDLASGVAHRLHRAGFKIVMLELPQPMVVRATVSFASAVYQGDMLVENVAARLARLTADPAEYWNEGIIPVYVDPSGEMVQRLRPHVLVDGIMAKQNTGTKRHDAPIVIALGPGFTAPQEVHAVVETQRGHDLGKVYYEGVAAPNTGIPGEISGFGAQRVLRAPVGGIFRAERRIGDRIKAGESVGFVNDVPITSNIDGVVRGLLFTGLTVEVGTKMGDVDPRGREEFCRTISDKARAVGGGVLEAILHLGLKQDNTPGI